MKKLIFMITLLISTNALAESSSLNLQLPNNSGNYAADRIKTDKLDCSNSISGAAQLEFGVTGIIDNYEGPFRSNDDSIGSSSKDIGVYARVTIPLDKPKERINCNTLYQLELKKKRLEVMKLEAELAKLRALQNEE